jgi:hypothetical protein
MRTADRGIDQAVEDTCAVVRDLAAACADDPHDAVEFLDIFAVFMRDRIETARAVQRQMAEARRHVEARAHRERQLLEYWMRRPTEQRTAADIEPFFQQLLVERRDLLPQKPHLQDVALVIATGTGGAQ